MWPEAPEQREEKVTNPYIGMVAFQLVEQINEGAIRVNRYFIMKKGKEITDCSIYKRAREKLAWRPTNKCGMYRNGRGRGLLPMASK